MQQVLTLNTSGNLTHSKTTSQSTWWAHCLFPRTGDVVYSKFLEVCDVLGPLFQQPVVLESCVDVQAFSHRCQSDRMRAHASRRLLIGECPGSVKVTPHQQSHRSWNVDHHRRWKLSHNRHPQAWVGHPAEGQRHCCWSRDAFCPCVVWPHLQCRGDGIRMSASWYAVAIWLIFEMHQEGPHSFQWSRGPAA